MKNTVVYLMSGAAHAHYLVVSLYSLRKHYDGDVDVFAYPESFEILKQIGQDDRLGISVNLWEPTYRGKNGQFQQKINLLKKLDNTVNLYIDADTLIWGDLSELFEHSEQKGFCATQFNSWKSNNGHAKKRVSNLIDVEGIPQEFVVDSMSNPHPSVNGGVFSSVADSPVLQDWLEWTNLVKETLFIADETVLHAVCRKWEPLDHIHILEGGAFNQSPMKKFRSVPDDDVRVFHGHGDSFNRPDKSQEGFDLWWPRYKEALQMDLGGITKWIKTINNKYLSRNTGWNEAVCS